MKYFRILKQLVGGVAALFLLWQAFHSLGDGELLYAGLYGVGVVAVALFTLDISD